MADHYLQFSCKLLFRGKIAQQRKWSEKRLPELVDGDSDDEEPRYVNYTVEQDGVWFCSEEHGDVTVVADFVQEFLNKFCPDGHFGFEWAESCSKLRLNEFGGGACLVTAHDQYWLSTGRWLNERVDDHRVRHSKTKFPDLTAT